MSATDPAAAAAVASSALGAEPPRRPLQVLLLSDGKPGHFMLAEAMVAALARRRPVAVRRVAVARPRWLPPRVLSTLTNATAGPAPRLARLLGLADDGDGRDADAPQRPDVVVSAGGDTLAANILAARRYGCPNLVYGSLRRYRPADVTLVLTSYAEHARRPGTVMTLKPSARDPDALPLPPPASDGPGTLGVLIGGDSGTVRYGPADWQRLLDLLGNFHAAGWRVHVANARRTPDDVGDRLAALAAGGVLTFVDVRTAGPGTLDPLLAASHAVVATVDSSSMISEAVWLRRPVVVVAPRCAALPPLEQGYRDGMSVQGWTTAPLALDAVTPDAVRSALASLRPLTGNPLDDLADLLGDRLPGLI